MKSRRKWVMLAIGAIVILGGGYGGYRYLQQSNKVLSTDDAYVDGRQIMVVAPASGQIENWVGHTGTTFPAGSTVGNIQVQAGDATSNVAIPVPQSATIVERSAVDGEFVAAGTPLAYAYNLSKLWITADVKETLINTVALGAPVAVHVAAYPQITLHGHVQEIEAATASEFSLIPSRSDTANYTEVTQVIPVRIAITESPAASLVPGMDVTVDITKNFTAGGASHAH